MDAAQFSGLLAKEAEKRGFADWEIKTKKGGSFKIKIFKGELEQFQSAYPFGLGFRGTFAGKMGCGATEALTEDVIAELLDNAAQNAELIAEDEPEALFKGGGAYPAVADIPADVHGAAYKIELGKRLEKLLLAADSRVASVDDCLIGSFTNESAMLNSYGLSLTQRQHLAYAFASVQVRENGQTKVASGDWFGHDFADFKPETLAADVVKRAVSKLGAAKVKSGQYAVVIENRVLADLFSAFADLFSGERMEKGLSLLQGRLGQTIAAGCVTLKDDGICPLSPVSVAFDSEGVPARNKCLIENGVFKMALHNLKSARKAGAEPTGNGFGGIGGSIGISPTNLYISPGETDFDGLLKQMGNGLLMTDVGGLHAGANSISGDFSLIAEGFTVEGGKVGKPVEQITVAGNFLELLKQVTAVGSDLKFNMPGGAGAVGMPSVLVSKIDISGE